MLTWIELGPVWLSLRLAAVTTVILLIIGLPLAWWLVKGRSALCAPMNAVVTLPLVLPPSVLGFYILIALGPNGPIGQVTDALVKYVLPIMGGGNGAGAVPLSQIYEQISGEPAANYYSFAIIVLTIANLFCIVAGALLNRLGQVKPELTGDGTNIMPVDSNLIKEDVKVKVTLNDYTGALILCGTIYAVGRLFSKVLLPSVFGAQIHTFAYSIIFVVIIAALGIVLIIASFFFSFFL